MKKYALLLFIGMLIITLFNPQSVEAGTSLNVTVIPDNIDEIEDEINSNPYGRIDPDYDTNVYPQFFEHFDFIVTATRAAPAASTRYRQTELWVRFGEFELKFDTSGSNSIAGWSPEGPTGTRGGASVRVRKSNTVL